MRGAWAVVAAAMAVAVLAGAGAVQAQARAGLPDPEAAIVDELVVVSRHPEPAWWRVEGKDGAVVHVLGVLDAPMPPDVAWRREGLDSRLSGADRLIVGARLHAGLEDIFGLISLWSQLRSKTPMEQGLDPALAARFAAERERIGQGPDRYAHWRPFFAGLILLADARPKGSRDVGRQIRAEAARKNVPVKPAGEYDLVPFARTAFGSMTPVAERECLTAALDDAEQGTEAYRRAAEAWARGDVAVALTAPRRFDRCLLLMAGGPELWRRSNDDLAAAITEQLAKPGHAVAVVPLRRLLAKGGLIDTLKAQGFRVVGPDDPAE